MEREENGLTTLSNYQKTSDSYLQELQDQVQDLRAKVLEEKIITAQLEQIQCGLQGRESVFEARTQESEEDIKSLLELKTLAEKELQAAKEEMEQLDADLLTEGQGMLRDIKNFQGGFDELVHRFKSQTSMAEYDGSETERCEKLQDEIAKVESKMQDADKQKEELQQSTEVFSAIDDVIEYYEMEGKAIEVELAQKTLKIHAKQLVLSQRQ